MRSWIGKRVLVIGVARQGIALGRYLAKRGARVLLNDQKTADQLEPASEAFDDLESEALARIDWHLGGHPLSLLDGVDLVCPSGGVPLDLPLVQEARRRRITLTNDSQVFLEDCPCPTIGITGSAGKTTTTTLVGKIAEHAFSSNGANPRRKAWVGGNIGAPLISVLDDIQPADLAVIELSSFQLELMSKSVQIACILNITPNHLDRHPTMEAYTAAKRRILEFQTAKSTAVLGQDDPGAWALTGAVKGECASFGLQKPPQRMQGAFVEDQRISLWDGSKSIPVVGISEIQLRGWHNVENVLAACAICQAAGLPVSAMREVISSFTGVPHRLEWVHTWRGADWYNDSIATAPERVIAAIHSFDNLADINRPIVLLAGGRDKNLPWDDLAKLIHSRVEHLVLFGEAAQKIASIVGTSSNAQLPHTVQICPGLEDAVSTASHVVEAGDIVLLSPGCTSFDEFRDFEERGEAFKRWVFNLTCV